MELHLRCLYHHDANGRIRRTRQPGGGPSPLFHLGRTRLGNLWRLRADLDAAVVRDLARLAGREAPRPVGVAHAEPAAPPERVEALRRLLESEVGELAMWCGPAFHFPQPAPPQPAPPRQVPPHQTQLDQIDLPQGAVSLVELTPDRADLLRGGFEDMIPELAERQPCIAAVEGEYAVSLCFSSRPLAVAGNPDCPAAEAGVETRPDHRGRGLAPRVVAAWARAVRERGAEPIYSTSWDNAASRAVARKLGLVCYGEDLHFSQAPRLSQSPRSLQT